jgi:hypothetical protein
MTLNDLKEWVNKLPEDKLEYLVVVRDVQLVEDDTTKLNYKDSPIMSALPDDNNKRIVLHGHESQANINEFRAKNADLINKDTKSEE